MDTVFAYFLTTDKAIITKLDQHIKQVKLLHNGIKLGGKGAWNTKGTY